MLLAIANIFDASLRLQYEIINICPLVVVVEPNQVLVISVRTREREEGEGRSKAFPWIESQFTPMADV
jgi:hypothetical protein